jgi:hypothetical protein
MGERTAWCSSQFLTPSPDPVLEAQAGDELGRGLLRPGRALVQQTGIGGVPVLVRATRLRPFGRNRGRAAHQNCEKESNLIHRCAAEWIRVGWRRAGGFPAG